MTNAVKKYEKVPKHKEMISDSMFHNIANLSSRTSEDLLIRAITDLIALGCYTGFHKSEWCSDHHNSFATIYDPNWGDHPMSLPIVAEDFSFSSAAGHSIHNLTTMADIDIAFTLLCFCKQENHDTGQNLTFWCRSDSNWMCPMQASLKFFWLAQRLGTPRDSTEPVYRDPATGERQQITATQVVAFLRHTAQKVFNIPARHNDPLAWHCHIIHVTTTYLPHLTWFSDSYIKNRLRWCSNTFLIYLRNIFYTTNQHTKAISLGLLTPLAVDLHGCSNPTKPFSVL
jgi:hypothetical protein